VPPPPVVQNVPPPPVVQNVPPHVPVVEPVPPAAPPGAAPARRESSTKVMLSGIGTYVLAYGLTALVGAIASAADDPAADRLFIPVVGPLLFWEGTDGTVNAEGGMYLILSTVFQAVGILGFVVGLAGAASGDPDDDGLAP
jgi:hypothetical protein